MTIAPDTPWRSAGDTTVAGLRAEFQTQRNSPLVGLEADLIAAAGGHSRLMAAISWAEAKHDTYPGQIPKAYHNFLSLSLGMVGGQHVWEQFDSYAACVRAWLIRLNDPDGPYAGATTVREVMAVYTPASDNATLTNYAARICSLINRMPLVAAKGTIMTDSKLTFHRVVAPLVEHHDLDPDINTAWDYYGQRLALFVVLHSTYGGDGWDGLMGTEKYFLGDARATARTDYGLDNRGGRIVRWTDPLSTYSPYASGPYQSPSGDAMALVAKLGILAINQHGISIEDAGGYGDPVTDIAFERLCRLIAFWADYNEIPHDVFPINPKTGLTFLYYHGEFNGEKVDTCPNPAVRARLPKIIVRVGEILKAAQTGGTVAAPVVKPSSAPSSAVPVKIPPAPPTGLLLPEGASLDMVKGWFGTVTSNGDKAMTFGFNESGPLTKLWLERGRKTGVWPQLVSVTGPDGNRLFRFDGGWSVSATAKGVKEVAA